MSKFQKAIEATKKTVVGGVRVTATATGCVVGAVQGLGDRIAAKAAEWAPAEDVIAHAVAGQLMARNYVGDESSADRDRRVDSWLGLVVERVKEDQRARQEAESQVKEPVAELVPEMVPA